MIIERKKSGTSFQLVTGTLRKLEACATFFLIGFLSAQAQEPPALAVPERATWTVKITYPDDSPEDVPTEKTGARLRWIESRVEGDLKRDILIRGDGRREEVWYRQGLRLASDGERAFVTTLESDEAEGTNIGLVYTAGFPGTGWILPEHSKGSQSLGKIECEYYEFPGGEAEAWIDAASGRPVRARVKNRTYDFQYGPVPSDPLQMPANYAGAWKKFETLQHRRAAIREAVKQ